MMVSVNGASAAIFSGSLVAPASADGTSPASRTIPLRESLVSFEVLSSTMLLGVVLAESGLLIVLFTDRSTNRAPGKAVALLSVLGLAINRVCRPKLNRR